MSLIAQDSLETPSMNIIKASFTRLLIYRVIKDSHETISCLVIVAYASIFQVYVLAYLLSNIQPYALIKIDVCFMVKRRFSN